MPEITPQPAQKEFDPNKRMSDSDLDEATKALLERMRKEKEAGSKERTAITPEEAAESAAKLKKEKEKILLTKFLKTQIGNLAISKHYENDQLRNMREGPMGRVQYGEISMEDMMKKAPKINPVNISAQEDKVLAIGNRIKVLENALLAAKQGEQMPEGTGDVLRYLEEKQAALLNDISKRSETDESLERGVKADREKLTEISDMIHRLGL
ncbi:MAG: hypothetical protein ABII13_03175 [Patescibacteria group bacterium]|nr:hypothetical protein [Patescibacteria group bacterium]MBU2509325.1 hypothetical protein [Patescibacteria group bacterium]